MNPRNVIVGGGAAGFFGAITCARAAENTEVLLLESGTSYLSKVRVSGGGRCNVTHACTDPATLSTNYPRGGRALIGPFTRFGPADTEEWFARAGVSLKTEPDGRMFPTTDRSATIVECLVEQARLAGVQFHDRSTLSRVEPNTFGGFDLFLAKGERIACDKLLIATGGCRPGPVEKMLLTLGHEIEPPVPSLFTFHVDAPWVAELAGISANPAEVSVAETNLRETGPVLFTHAGFSGPAILRLSAWGARHIHSLGYQFKLRINWLPDWNHETILSKFQEQRSSTPNRLLASASPVPIPARLWEKLTSLAKIPADTRWNQLTKAASFSLADLLLQTELLVSGKTMNKEEFVTAGGVRLRDVDLKTMQSRITPGLFFAGEVLDIDGITGGFNFQAAWTTAWLAGHAMAGLVPEKLT